MINIKILKNELEKRKIPNDLYSLKGGFPNDTYCLNLNKDVWEVYYSEKGIKSGLKFFKTENDACIYFLDIILKNL